MTTTTYSRTPRRRHTATRKPSAIPAGCAPPERDRLAAQQKATSYLVESCERALFDLRCAVGRAASADDVRVGLEAAALLEDVLATWRITLRQLSTAREVPSDQTDAGHGR